MSSKWVVVSALLVANLVFSPVTLAQGEEEKEGGNQSQRQSSDDGNQRLQKLWVGDGEGRSLDQENSSAAQLAEYRIGPEDLLEINVFEAPTMNRSVRVTSSGHVSLPLLGSVRAGGLTARELEFVIQEVLRRTVVRDPHVGVFVREMRSHPVSVFGAVGRPGVLQLTQAKPLIEVLSMAEGLAVDAGDTVIVTRGSNSPLTEVGVAADPFADLEDSTEFPARDNSESLGLQELADSREIRIKIKDLLETGDPRHNILIYPGDVVKVPKAGIVYVVGEVKKPGGFVLESNENVSVLQVLAFAQGLTSTASKDSVRIIRTQPDTGERSEIPLDIGKILSGESPDPLLQSKDILIIPGSTGRTVLLRGVEAALSIVSGLIIFNGRR